MSILAHTEQSQIEVAANRAEGMRIALGREHNLLRPQQARSPIRRDECFLLELGHGSVMHHMLVDNCFLNLQSERSVRRPKIHGRAANQLVLYMVIGQVSLYNSDGVLPPLKLTRNRPRWRMACAEVSINNSVAARLRDSRLSKIRILDFGFVIVGIIRRFADLTRMSYNRGVTIIDFKRLTAHRTRTFHLPPAKPLSSQSQALRFVNERGFIYFWPIKGIDLPSLWTAVAGDRPVPDAHDDPAHVTWGWKDDALPKRIWYYAKILHRKATMIALDVVPYFYALSQNYGSPGRRSSCGL